MNQPQSITDILAGVKPNAAETPPPETRNEDEAPKRNPAWDFANKVYAHILRDARRNAEQFADLSDPETYQAHSRLIIEIANRVCLAGQGRKFIVDDNNRDVLRFLLYYFNHCPLACDVFPGKGHKLDKHILLMGGVGTGKTLTMQIFSEYLRYTNNPNFFHNVSVTQMVNYFTIHNNIDRYTFNEESSTGFQCKPMNVCLNDLGVDNRPFYGIDTTTITSDFLHARNEIWAMTSPEQRKFAHITTNLTIDELKQKYADAFGRLIDRFKTYNIIKLTGDSRR
ncbi:MAG: hypothetical protein NC401_10415 [Ruminococcus sp.]|nr:hypothetical protein [Ruminococcus sp.]MCM1438985.1 hypothetical protein [Roseburia sp.]